MHGDLNGRHRGYWCDLDETISSVSLGRVCVCVCVCREVITNKRYATFYTQTPATFAAAAAATRYGLVGRSELYHFTSGVRVCVNYWVTLFGPSHCVVFGFA